MNIHISLLEWTDDLEVFILKGYGKSINYHMGLPLLQDVVQSMGQAIKAKEGINTILQDLMKRLDFDLLIFGLLYLSLVCLASFLMELVSFYHVWLLMCSV
ncbi:hypothetical protein IFM89_036560 [Coptis chinensis]|uniref:Uncharacterized protein n=1 Tax=Coptis chinensis TaxID=261450 RepID=A0A835HJ38_9MAGN|nr:hypothetical protein IFM89_036560 [Coptis chinensis]